MRKDVRKFMKRLIDHGEEAYLVGGAVRDLLLNRKTFDYDITTSSSPEKTKELFSDVKYYDIGKKHGTITLISGNITVDITPFRKEDHYFDHRHPEYVEFTDHLIDDLKRRDFTVNAICLDEDSSIIDYFNGLEDLRDRKIRCIGDPDERFNEDALRILRAIRFSCVLDFSIEENTKRSLFANKDLLVYLSPERKREELFKILKTEKRCEALSQYREIFETFLPAYKTDETALNFSDPIYTLAWILEDTGDLSSLSLSKAQEKLLRHLHQYRNIGIEDDTSFIEALVPKEYRKDTLSFLEEREGKDLKERYSRLKRYIVSRSELNLKGEDMKKAGYSGKTIREAQDILLDAIHRQEIYNRKDMSLRKLRER